MTRSTAWPVAVGGDKEHAIEVARKLRTGQVDVNGGAFNPSAPFGGYKQSGIGRERGKFGFEEFLEVSHPALIRLRTAVPSDRSPTLVGARL